ncbi:phosphotransferase [Aestuariimicrobium soli]|uniref:phosphotransferase n=1 Tax=Aestuariimicrobium soli TaxID=2035834 RepID=UPI003EBEF57D
MPTDSPNRPDPTAAPAPLVVDLAAGRALTPVWQNPVIGSSTWRIDDTSAAESGGDPVEYVKVGPPHWEFEVESDVARHRWLATHVPVPEVLSFGERDGLRFLHTRALPGRSAVSHDFPCGDEAIVRGLGQALRRFHDTVPVADCPNTWSADERLARLPRSAIDADETLLVTPPLDDANRVVCHGDACNPNFLFDGDGTFTGYVDLGFVGVADRWADLAPAILSLGWNFGEDADLHAHRRDLFLDGYGIALDHARLDHYTRLWNAGG